MKDNNLILRQLIWLITEEKKFYDTYNSHDTYNSNDTYNNHNDINIINYVNYIETLYDIIFKV